MWDIRTSGCIHVFDQHDTHAGSSSRQSRQGSLPPAALCIESHILFVLMHLINPISEKGSFKRHQAGCWENWPMQSERTLMLEV